MSNDNQHPKATLLDISNIQPSNINSFALPDGLPERAKDAYTILQDVHPFSFEKFLNSFRADNNPEREMEVWELIAEGYTAFINENPRSSKAKRKEIFNELLRVSVSGVVVTD